MRGHNRADQAGKAQLEFRRTRRIMDLDSVPLASDQTGFAEDLKVLREGGLGDRFITDRQKIRARLRAALSDDAGIDGCACGVGKRMQNALDRYILNRRMEQGPHT